MDTTRLKDYFTGLQSRIVAELETFDGQPFRTDSWTRPEGGGGISRLIEEGDFFERSARNWPGAPGRPWASRWFSTRATRTARLPT